MTHEFSQRPVVSNDESTTLLVAETETFVAFDLWMDAQLEQLVAQWIHTAAPNASRLAVMSNRFGRSVK